MAQRRAITKGLREEPFVFPATDSSDRETTIGVG